MTFLYDGRYSIALLRRRYEVTPLTKSAEKSMCMGKWPVPNWGEFFHYGVVACLKPELADQTGLLPNGLADMVLSITDEGTGTIKSKTRIQRSNFADFRPFESSF